MASDIWTLAQVEKGGIITCSFCGHYTCTAGCPDNSVSPVYVCDGCSSDICSGEDYYKLGGGIYCSDCIFEAKREAE